MERLSALAPKLDADDVNRVTPILSNSQLQPTVDALSDKLEAVTLSVGVTQHATKHEHLVCLFGHGLVTVWSTSQLGM